MRISDSSFMWESPIEVSYGPIFYNGCWLWDGLLGLIL
jgi:hypothetical protein